MSGFKSFHGSFRETWRYGGFQDIDVIVIAETESAALGVILEHPDYKETNPKLWLVEEIPLTERTLIHVSEAGT